MFIYVKDAKYLGDYKIEVEFNDGKKGVVDLIVFITEKRDNKRHLKVNLAKILSIGIQNYI